MIRKIATFKYAVFGLFGFALVSAACSDDDDALFDGGAGKSSGGAGSGGKANTAGTNSSGATAGETNGGTSAGTGTAGTTSHAGTGGASAGSAPMGGEGGAVSGGAGGAGGAAGESVGGEGGAISGGAGGAGGEGGTAFVPDVLDNPGFEVGTSTNITGWTNEGTTGAAYIEYSASAHGGQNKLSHWTAWVDGVDYTARTYQTVAPIANGTYSFSIWVDRNYFKTQYLFARGFNAADPAQEMTQVTDAAEAVDGYAKITLTGIPVTSGTITVGVYSSVVTGTYTNFDDAELTLE